MCILCDSSHPTTAHVLGGCPVALSQDRYTYWHDLVIQSLADSFYVALWRSSSYSNSEYSIIADLQVYSNQQMCQMEMWTVLQSPDAVSDDALIRNI